jgi:hypothetical protein
MKLYESNLATAIIIEHLGEAALLKIATTKDKGTSASHISAFILVAGSINFCFPSSMKYAIIN